MTCSYVPWDLQYYIPFWAVSEIHLSHWQRQPDEWGSAYHFHPPPPVEHCHEETPRCDWYGSCIIMKNDVTKLGVYWQKTMANVHIYVMCKHKSMLVEKILCFHVNYIKSGCLQHWQHYTLMIYMYTNNLVNVSMATTKVHEYSDAQKKRERERKKTKQHNTTPETTFSKENAALRWDSNPYATYFRCDAPPTELLRQLSWLSSKSPM